MRHQWSTSPLRPPPEQVAAPLFELYHENSKLFAALAQQQAAQFSVSPYELYLSSRGFRQYRHAPRLPLPEIIPSAEPLAEVMCRRRSTRHLQGTVSFMELASVLQQSLGPTAVLQNEEPPIIQALRVWPSAGGLYPIDTYVVASKVEDLAPGLYHYNVMTSELESLPSRAPHLILQDGFFWQEFAATAAVALLLVAVFERTVAKYGERGYRFVLLDAGHAAQNVLLTAEQLHLGAVAIGGFCDDSLATDLGIDGVSEAVVHSIMIGKVYE